MSTPSSDVSIEPLTPQELSSLVVNPEFRPQLEVAFTPGHNSTTTLRYYTFLSNTIDTLEQELEQHQLEWEAMFDQLGDSDRFWTHISPIIELYRWRKIEQWHPRIHPCWWSTPPS